jgi:hypothetical protein
MSGVEVHGSAVAPLHSIPSTAIFIGEENKAWLHYDLELVRAECGGESVVAVSVRGGGGSGVRVSLVSGNYGGHHHGSSFPGN